MRLFNTVIVPRISETNAAGHIGLTVIPVWLEVGYDEILRLFYPDLRESPKLIALNLRVDCLAEIFYGKNVEVMAWIDKIGGSSFVIYEEIYQEGQLCARGTTTFIHFNYDSKRAEPIPQNIRLKLEEHIKAN